MKQKRQIILTLILGFSQLLASEVQEQKKFQGFGFKGIQNGKAVIEFENSNYELKSVEHMGTIYQKPEIALSGAMINEGDPYLPSITTFYAVEPGKSYSASVSVLASEAIDNIDILPFQGWDKDKHDADLPMIRNHVFESDAQFPSNIVHVSEPIVMRDLTLVKVTLTPFQYNPVSKVLTVIQNAEISLEVSGESESHFQPAKRSRAFEPLYKSLVVNYEDFSRNAGDYQRPSILYVLPSNIGGLMSTVQLLMDWKHRLGYEVNYVSSSNVVNSSTNLKNYLEDAYETWDNPPEFVTLVGDVNGTYDIPTFFENFSSYNGEGDHPYSQLAGSDLFPEVMLGRLSFSSQSELNTIVGKNINYESAPYMGEDWYSRACLTGDPNTSGISCIITNENIEEILELHEYTDINTIYSGSFPSQMLSGLNAGVSFFNYRGWIGTSGFGSGDINNSSNGFMLPIATMITCATGSFSGSSIIESFLRAGTASVPKGAVASIGTATSGTHTMFNNLVDIGFYYGVFMDEIETAGAALMQAKLYLAKGYPSNPSDFVSIFTHWNNLMGDASLQMRTKFPTTLSVDFESWVTTGTNYVDIHVGSGSMSVQGAWVTILRDGDIFESGYTDPSGNLRLNIPSSISGEVLITVSKRNHYPYQSSFQIYDPGVSVNIVSNNITIDDDNMGQSSGNGNGIIESGETIELTIPLKNYGSTDASNINASIASEHSQISIISGSINYGDIASQESMAPASPFVVQVEAGMGESESFSLSLNIVAFEGDSWSAVVPFAVNGNQIIAQGIQVLGNSNNVLTPGQTSTFEIVLANEGSTSATNITGTIITPSSMIEISDDTGVWSYIVAGESGTNSGNTFSISASEEALPGTIAHLMLNLESLDGYITNLIIPVQIGMATVHDPLGPDDYGYYVYDNEDALYNLSPYYNWIEIDDRIGGSGNHLTSLTDNGNNGDDVETISLPFTFNFYGQTYNTVSICSNGWLAVGEASLASFRNYELPGPMGPAKMIAGFWDDLQLTSGGRVYTWYDESNHQFIVEWSDVKTYQNNSTNTFQIILKDPSHYLTPTGDGEILMQYKEFNNTSYGDYSWGQTHGNYATVGIQDHNKTRGLTYTWNNTYPTAAMQLGNETAILFTSRGSDVRMFGDLNADDAIDIFDILGLVDYILDPNAPVNPYLGDMNQDGIINYLDVLGLVRTVMQW